MSNTQYPLMRRQLDALAHEISKLAIACDIDIGQEELANRILNNDETICGRKNSAAFEQLRHHLMALLTLEGEAIEDLGAERAINMLNEIFASIAKLRKTGSANASVPRQF